MVTGGSSGVGKATVKALMSEGVRVTAVARGADRLRALAAEVGDGLTTLEGDAAVSRFPLFHSPRSLARPRTGYFFAYAAEIWPTRLAQSMSMAA